MNKLTLRTKLRKKLQPVFRGLKWKRFCKMGLNGLDEKLEKYLDFEKGIFAEAGANNGIKQSNTYYLEAVKGWQGILVEPVPQLYAECVKNRPSAKVYQAALVSDYYAQETVELSYADLMTVVKENEGSEAHATKGKEIQNIAETYDFEAPALTLSKIIEESGFGKIDFLSLDLEGYEVEALRGLDLSRWGPRYLLVELRDLEKILSVLGTTYRQLEVLTDGTVYKDILFLKND